MAGRYPAQIAHDEHFLIRLSRLERSHAELALGLYHDHELVQLLLGQASVPDGADRVALSLDDPVEGPFVIVARNGHFVTCLGKGMKLPDDQPVITRHKLDRLSEKVTGLRELIAGAKSDHYRKTRRLLRRVQEAGDRLTREEFDDLARWMPLLGKQFFVETLQNIEQTTVAWERITRIKRLSASRHQKVLRAYWRSTWATAHFALLLGTDNGATLERAFELIGDDGGGDDDFLHSPRSALFPWILSRLAVTPFALRGAWVASKIPKLITGSLKRAYARAETTNATLAMGIGLYGIGLRHKSYHAEVGKALARAPKDTRVPEYVQALRSMIEQHYAVGSSSGDAMREHVVTTARKFLAGIGEETDDPELNATIAELPDDVTVAFLLSTPLGIFGRADSLIHLLDCLPWVANAEARDFYVPRRYGGLQTGPWHREEAEALVRPRLEHEGPDPAAAAPKTPARNAPCPCGSGKKYKRCCGAA